MVSHRCFVVALLFVVVLFVRLFPLKNSLLFLIPSYVLFYACLSFSLCLCLSVSLFPLFFLSVCLFFSPASPLLLALKAKRTIDVPNRIFMKGLRLSSLFIFFRTCSVYGPTMPQQSITCFFHPNRDKRLLLLLLPFVRLPAESDYCYMWEGNWWGWGWWEGKFVGTVVEILERCSWGKYAEVALSLVFVSDLFLTKRREKKNN